ncbi:succinylglutamate desuccinylase [Marinobacter lacisalsi]|uniref:Succinylglutamate desuccinylase n=1 Tax=Marinobacter lacisalsi TaxID=475979 RepID=A0ABV8QG96_9GAMM
MPLAQALFDGHDSWLDHTLALGEQPCGDMSVTMTDGGQLHRQDTGLLCYHPAYGSPETPALILSAGIHGNETAPIELLNALVDSIVTGRIRPAIPLLLILGNPPAMVAAERFMDHNLNRLFCGAWQDYPDCHETRRAAQLEGACRSFREQHKGPFRHYDLHTAIRPSRREKFALYPFLEGRQVPETELAFLTEAGIGTLLLQHGHGTTFSSFSSEQLDAESFTLELGKVHPFGHNDLSRIADLEAALTRLIRNEPAPVTTGTQPPDIFVVVHEILNTGDHFRFHIPDEEANFTEYPPGTLIWEDDITEYRVGPEPEAIIFPNPRVPVGHRVGLMVRRRSG